MTRAIDVCFYEVFSEEEEALKRYLPESIRAEFARDPVSADSKNACPSKLISIRTQSVIPSAWMKRIRGILTRSTGYDHLLSQKIPCGYLPNYCARSVAEHAVMGVMVLIKKLKRELKQFDQFNRNHLTGFELEDKNLLVVGVGHIGLEVAKLGRGMGMSVWGVDPVRKDEEVEYVDLASGLKHADAVVCALPLTDKTKGLLNYRVLQEAKRGFVLVNVGRGETSPILDLKRLLDEGHLGGLALDVYEDESRLAAFLSTGAGELSATGQAILSLKDDDRVLLTPHNAFNTQEALDRKAKQSVDSILHFLQHQAFPHPIPV